MSAKKLCVFCGNLPDEKTKEHIIPKWLLELTGDPNREGYFGAHIPRDGGEMRQRKFALSSFHFPACRTCNEEFGKLESQAKVAMLRVLANEEVSNGEITTLLDWFDKVRIGLWLAFNRLDDLSDTIPPPFHIRIGRALKDRALLIYDFENPARSSLSAHGMNSPIFHVMPNSFILMVRDKLFLSAAADYLVAESLGFCYGEPVATYDDGVTSEPFYGLHPGTGKVTYPVLNFRYIAGGTEIYQVVSSAENFTGPNSEEIRESMEDEYFQRNSFAGYASDDSVRVSRAFYKRPGGELTLLGEDESVSLQPPERMGAVPMGDVMFSLLLGFQLRIWQHQMPAIMAATQQQLDILPQSIRTIFEAQIAFTKATATNFPQGSS